MLRRLAAKLSPQLKEACGIEGGSSHWAEASTSYFTQSTTGFSAWLGVQLQQSRSKASASQMAGLKAYKPTTPGLRGRVITLRQDLWRGGPYKALTEGFSKTGGRNNLGRITSWHRGGGHRKVYRLVDFVRKPVPEAGRIERLEYDPNRSARIALVRYPASGSEVKDKHAYILAPQNVRAGDSVVSGPTASIRPGNTLPLTSIPIGSTVHNVELLPGRGGQIARSAGTSATLVSRGEGPKAYAVIKLPSGEQRSVLARCTATIGAISNPQHKNRKHGKAGARRWQGRRPVVRGVAMNSVDHPHGGGRGKSKGRISQTPWGVPTKGYKTRKKRNITDSFIQLSRHKLKAARR